MTTLSKQIDCLQEAVMITDSSKDSQRLPRSQICHYESDKDSGPFIFEQ